MMHTFFATLSRLSLIRRWSLMRSTQPENDAEHSLQTAMIAHTPAVMARDRYFRDVRPEHVMALAAYHDVAEVLTGDLPTPVKYHSPALRDAYRQVERLAQQRLLRMLPADLQPALAPYLMPAHDADYALVKAADKISAYVKCLTEQRAGNHEFDAAAQNLRRQLDSMELPEVRDFMREFVPAFTLNLDELNATGL